MKKVLAVVLGLFLITSCTKEEIVNQIETVLGGLTQDEIGQGLREALDKGVDNQVKKLTKVDGFYKNELVKILLPKELKEVDAGLRKIGLGSLADEGLKAINRTAEDAVKTATPIFVDAIKQITFEDAKNILLGDEKAATTYLQQKTQQALYKSFEPVISKSFSKVGADEIWTNLISKYNNIPLVNKVNPNLTEYVTNEALKGVFTMIAVEEKAIRTDVNKRTTDLLKKVFKLQDK